MKRKNPVARFSHHFNKAVKHRDRKKAKKAGYQKHKPRYNTGLFIVGFVTSG